MPEVNENIKVVEVKSFKLERIVGTSKTDKPYDIIVGHVVLEDGAEMKCNINEQDFAHYIYNRK